MRYVAFPITDLGYATPDGTPLPNIWGLDNLDQDGIDLRFIHLGYVGYPTGARCCIDAPDKSKTLAVFEDGADIPASGSEVAASDLPAWLMTELGWPVGTTMGSDGLPLAPAPEV